MITPENNLHKPPLNGRLKPFVWVVCVLAGLIFVQLIRLHIFQSEELTRIAQRQYRSRITIQPLRGTIYDRAGTQLTNMDNFVSLGINPSRVLNPERLSRELAEITQQSQNYYLDKLKSNHQFIYLDRKLPQSQVDQIKELGWTLRFENQLRRIYPHGQRVAQVLGFTDVDDVGRSGLELKYNDLLSGKAGSRIVQLDVQGRQYLDDGLPFVPPKDGGDIILTIELPIQSILEDELEQALEYYGAKRASGLIIDPRNGELFAMATLPSLDPNQFSKYPSEQQRNMAVTDMYEFGSVFKVITTALMLEKELVTAETTVDTDPGWLTVNGKTFRDYKNYGLLGLNDVLAYSSNVGMIRLATQLSSKDIYDMIIKFGFNEQTGIELPGETRGNVPKPDSWTDLKKSTIVIGQGVAISMLQLGMAYSAIANGGYLVQPTLIRGLRESGSQMQPNETVLKREVISPYTASVLTDCLIGTVEYGTAKRARITGMSIAGKTGTAQKVDFEKHKYYQDKYIATFVGYFPARAPRYLILISVDEANGPNDEHGGGSVAAPVFNKIARRILEHKTELWNMGGESDELINNQQVAVPDYRFKRMDDVKMDLAQLKLKYKVSGRGQIVYDQIPTAGSRISSGDLVRLTVGPIEGLGTSKVVVPLVAGLSLRDAIEKITTAGLTFKVKGSGTVMEQLPVAGTQVSLGKQCLIIGKG